MVQQILIFAALLCGLLAGGGVSWLVLRERSAAAAQRQAADSQVELIRQGERLVAAQQELARLAVALDEAQAETQGLEQELGDLRERLGAADATARNQAEQLARLHADKETLETAREQLQASQQRLGNQVAELSTALEAERSQSADKLRLLQNAEEQLANRFKTLAGEILEDKSRRFTEQNQLNLGQLLEPLKVKIGEFQGQVQAVYVQEGKDRTALAEQVKQLMALNSQLSKDAHNLTSALKGQSKAQGNWGELVLEKVLEASGLRREHEYDVQESHSRADGTRAQPDVVIHLPEDKHLVVDAKMSLTAYEAYVNAETDALREQALKRHLDSVRAHVRELADKNYQQLYGFKSLDFVLMFIPVEPAFMLAIAHDGELWQDAWKRNVLLVSPSTLLFVVRTVAHLWRQEQQNRNAQEIAKRGAALYDKLAGFVDDLNGLGERLQQAQRAYDSACGKFSKGAGNVIRQAEMLKELGVKPAKQLSGKMLDAALEDAEKPAAE